MESVTEKEKHTLNQKLLEFQQKGLLAYNNYLEDQLAFASKSKIRSAYKKYIEDQIAMNLRKIVEIEVKLKG